MKGNKIKLITAIIAVFLLFESFVSIACTGITLKSNDGAVIVARTVEWALSNANHNKILIVPRNKIYRGLTPEGNNGMKWTGKYGFVTLTAYGQPYGPDGLNEEGLYVGVYYLPGFAEYATYDRSNASNSMSVGDFMQWMLSSFKTVDEIMENINRVTVVSVENEEFGGAELPFHFKIADSNGNSKIIEIVNNGELKIYEPYLGVITNSPTYDWHIINQRNYLGLSTLPNTSKDLGTYELSPLGGGSGLIGLPGDFTPPSRFIRAAAFTASCRPLPTAKDAVFESFRILDNFNIPIGAQVPEGHLPSDIVSATQITTSSDLKNKTFYFHTMWNRQVQKIELNKIDFSRVQEQVLNNQTQENEVVDLTNTINF